MRTSADKRAISEAQVIPSRLRPRGAQFVVNDEYISSPITQYQAIMELPNHVETLIVEVEDYFKHLFSRNKSWSTTYESEIGAFQERARKLTAHYPNNADLQTLQTSLYNRRKNLDERKAHLDRSQPGTGLESQEFEFLNLDLERKLNSDLEQAIGSEQNVTPILSLTSTVGNMLLSHQHALRLVRSDIKTVHDTMNKVFDKFNKRHTNLDQSINN